MSVLVVGSVALDTIETPFGKVEETIGGAATFFSAAASLFHPVQLVAVVGSDYPMHELDFLRERGVDFSGLQQEEGENFFWSGVYSYDLNSRETLETRLGVFADFKPEIPASFREAEWVFLGNIHPSLQLDVLEQIRGPRLVACDTMNYWIENTRDELLELLGKVDVLMVNDSEARQLTGDYNLLRAARWIQERGPKYVVVKKGEHGALLFTPDMTFFAPGFPLETIYDPTGAGDAFGGGFMGWLAAADRVDDDELRRAMVYGSALGSFVVERFGVERLRELDMEEIQDRFGAFRELTAFEHGATSHV